MSNYQNLLLGFLLFFVVKANAQYVFPDDPQGFIQMAGQMMTNTKSERSIRVYNEFSSVWTGSLDENTKKSVIRISQDMARKRLRASTNFTDFYSALVSAVQRHRMSSADIDSILYVTEKVLKHYDAKARNEFFQTMALFLEKDLFYSSAYNQLHVKTSSFKFSYIEALPDVSPIDAYDQALEGRSGDDLDYFDDWDNQEQVQEDWSGGWDDWGDDGWDDEQTSSGGFEEQQNHLADMLNVGYAAPPQPVIQGAVIELEESDLAIVTEHDSAVIRKTTGTLMLKDGVFVGNGGMVDWATAGAAPDEIFVELKEYNFNVKSPKFNAEQVVLHYPQKTDELVEGVFEFQSKKKIRAEDAQYPRFKSFASNIPLKGVGENIEYYGGLSLEGRKIYSSSLDEGRSRILIKRNGEVKIKAIANRFEISDSTILGNIASIVIYQGNNDSIYHPGTILQYTKNNSTLRLTKTSGYRYTPFIDTYHRMEITVDALIWNIETSQIQFSITNAASELTGKFESNEFFEANKYARLQGVYRFHPLQMIIGYAEGQKAKTKADDYEPFTIHELATTFKIEENTLRGAMVSLMRQGFIDYKPRSGEITIRAKAVHYVKARRDQKDYDNLSFESLEPSGNNATLDLDSRDLTVRGVDMVRIMDSLNIFIIPESKTLVIKGDRGFAFDGRINTANFQFIGKNFEFNYDSFLVHMPEIDKIRLAAIDPKEKGGRSGDKKARVLGNELRYSSGTLYLNKPDNKSGRVNYPEYPIFSANSGASVFFDKQEIAGGVYDTTIRFKIPPFTVDSLASNDPQSIGFDGEFESAGIFPVFQTKLVVMPDFSMGFEYAVPSDGFQLYEGKGRYFNKITMDNRGLTGNGHIEYLNTTCYSNQFHFFVDSVLTIGTNSDTKAGTHKDLPQSVTFPLLTVGEYEMSWKPRKDSMELTNMTDPFQLYDNSAKLNGTAIVTERGMLGSGVLETRGSVSISPEFHFEQKRFEGRHSTFTVRSEIPAKPAIRSSDCRLTFDLEKDVATFGPEVAGFASTEFPYLRYKTSIEKGVWYLNEERVVMNTEGHDISNSYFYSTHPHQDSLAFNAKAGIYDMKTLSLNIEGVPHINVIDGRLFPENNKVTIYENALMETLYNVKAEFDTVNAYHHLYDGTFEVKGRYRLRGTATYSYTNASGDNYSFIFKNYAAMNQVVENKQSKKKGKSDSGDQEEDIQALLVASQESETVLEELANEKIAQEQEASGKKKKAGGKGKKDKKSSKQESVEEVESVQNQHMQELEQPAVLNTVSERKRTVAVGLIYPEDSIEVAKKILYKGKVTMHSDLPELLFDGYVKLDLKGALSYSQWLQYKNDGDNTNVRIMLEDPKADNGNPLTTGLSINNKTDLYTTFISEKDEPEDFDVFMTKGILKFSSHPDSSIFKVASERKLQDPDMVAGNLFIYDDNNSTVEFSGLFNYIEENKGLRLLASGSGSAEIDSSFYSFNNMMVFKFAMHKTIPVALADNIRIVADIIPPHESEMIQDPVLLHAMEMKKNKKMLDLIGDKEYKNYLNKSAGVSLPLYQISGVFADGIVLSDVNMKWSNTHKAFYSHGPVKVANINTTEIDRVMTGYVEIRKTLNGDVVNLLLEPTPNNWYFFTYDNNRVAITSSSDEVNAVIAKRSKGEQTDRTKLFFVEADFMEKSDFLTDFKQKYLRGETGYVPDRIPKTSDEPVLELDIQEEEEPELVEEDYEDFDEEGRPVRKKQGKVIEEPELNRGKKEHSIEEKRRLQQEQERLRNLLK